MLNICESLVIELGGSVTDIKIGSNTHLVYYKDNTVKRFSTTSKIHYRYIIDCFFYWLSFDESEYKVPK